MGSIGHVEMCGCVSTVGPFFHVGSSSRVVPSDLVVSFGRVGLVGRVRPSGHVRAV